MTWVTHTGRAEQHTEGAGRGSVSHLAPIHLGLDVHKDTISVGILEPDQQVPEVDRIAHDEASVRRLLARFPDRARLRACDEAGPTGFELARLLHSMDVRCEVIAPSLNPKAPGDKIKTDKRDRRRLARLHRAGELVCIRIPTVAEEAVRDLCRTRGDMVDDLTRARNRLGRFLLRHGRVWRGGSTRTHTYPAWLGSQRLDHPAMTQTPADPLPIPGRPRRLAVVAGEAPSARAAWPASAAALPARPGSTVVGAVGPTLVPTRASGVPLTGWATDHRWSCPSGEWSGRAEWCASRD
jgi:Transposase